MQFELIDQTEKTIKIGIKDTDTTLITPIIEVLNGNKKVKIVRYIETHPELDTPALYVEMYEGDPKAAIIAAANIHIHFLIPSANLVIFPGKT